MKRRLDGGFVFRGRFRERVERVGHGANNFLDALACCGGDGEEAVAALGAVGAERIEGRAIGGGVELGGDDEKRLRGERVARGGKLAANDFKVVDGIAGSGAAAVDEMSEEARALDVAEEANAKAGAFMGALDEAGEVCDDEAAADAGARAVGGDDAEVGLKSGEGIVRDFGARGGDAGDESGLARIRQANEADISEEPELEADVALLAGVAIFKLARGLVPGFGEVLVAAPAAPTASGDEVLAGGGEVEEHLAGIVIVDDGADRNLEDGIRAGLAVAVGALAVATGVGTEFTIEAETEERVLVGSGDELDAATRAAVATGGAATRDELLPAEGDTTATAITGFHVDASFINKHGGSSAVSWSNYDTGETMPTTGWGSKKGADPPSQSGLRERS